MFLTNDTSPGTPRTCTAGANPVLNDTYDLAMQCIAGSSDDGPILASDKKCSGAVSDAFHSQVWSYSIFQTLSGGETSISGSLVSITQSYLPKNLLTGSSGTELFGVVGEVAIFQVAVPTELKPFPDAIITAASECTPYVAE